VLPELFDGVTSWEDWKLHFEDVAAVNEWTDGHKLKLLRVTRFAVSRRIVYTYGIVQGCDDGS
jgi:hypothetical protein